MLVRRRRSASKRAEERLRELNAPPKARIAERTRERDRAQKDSQDLLIVVDRRGVFRAANPVWTVMPGWLPDKVVGHSHLKFRAATLAVEGKHPCDLGTLSPRAE